MNEYKVLVELVVPEIDVKYDIYLPINRRIGNVIDILNKTLNELTNGMYVAKESTSIYDSQTGIAYGYNSLVRETNIRNGSTIVLF